MTLSPPLEQVQRPAPDQPRDLPSRRLARIAVGIVSLLAVVTLRQVAAP